MKPDQRFLEKTPEFWAHVKLLSQEIGYTKRGSNRIKVPSAEAIEESLKKLHIAFSKNNLNGTLESLDEYFQYRALVLNNVVMPNLMNYPEAKKMFNAMKKKFNPQCPLPLNKQKGLKSGHALLTGMVNMIIEKNLSGLPCNYNPMKLSYFVKDSFLVRTLSRRIDGAFPDIINPIAIWEIKEYYHTTTFGSRVADGIYETMMDGTELKELREKTGLAINHYLILDAKYTWWDKGRSYLCRIIDMLNMGIVTEVLFGKEIETRLPELVSEWIATKQ